VAKDETLYSLSKKYNTTVAIIRELNGLGDEGLKLGQTIKLPSINPVSIQTKPIEHSTKVIDPSKPSIPKSTDGKVTTEPEVNEKPQDKSPEKTQEKSPEKPETNPSKEGGIIESSSKGSKVKYVEKESKGTLKIVEATSIPAEDAQRAWVWFEDGKKNDVVAIINPQNNQIVYAMVQGEGKSKKSVTVTPFVAQKLGIFDEKTVVRVRYAVPNK
jgi:murein DD-endopeptidase MepM/ murein hydrolase activator NlpD